MNALRAGLLAIALLSGASESRADDEGGVTLSARVTAYCLQGTSRTGEWVRPGMVAVDPSVIPLRAQLTIEGFGGTYEALDTGGGVRGNHVDVWMSSCADALAWGSRERVVTWWGAGG